MAFEVVDRLFGFLDQLIKSGRAAAQSTAVDPFLVGRTQSLVDHTIHAPKIAGAKPRVYHAAMCLVQAILQSLPVSEIHALFYCVLAWTVNQTLDHGHIWRCYRLFKDTLVQPLAGWHSIPFIFLHKSKTALVPPQHIEGPDKGRYYLGSQAGWLVHFAFRPPDMTIMCMYYSRMLIFCQQG